MRISDKLTYDNVQRHLNKNREELVDLQTQAATQKRLNKPSDDPIATSRVLATKTEERGVSQFLKNGSIAQSFLDFSDQSLAEVSEALVRAKELVLAQANDPTANDQTRKVTATEINQLFWQSVQIANRKLGDRFVFAGHETTKPPFRQDGTYRGDRGDIKLQINKDTFLGVNIPGSQVFLGENLSDDGISRSRLDTPKNVNELKNFKDDTIREEAEFQNSLLLGKNKETPKDRSPASMQRPEVAAEWKTDGINIFSVFNKIETALKVGDKSAIQESIEEIDQAVAQVVLARAEIGSRLMSLESEMSTLSKNKIDAKVLTSQLEDADSFKVLSDITKNQATLEATLKTSGKLIQPSLLDFLR